jgi:hypothetical protein
LYSRYIEKKLTWTGSPDETVTFCIGKGDNVKKFVVHKEFACRYSPVLKKAFSSGFVEGQTQTYKLEDTTEFAFRFLTQWFYREKLDLDVHKDEISETGADHKIKCAKQGLALVELWTLADLLLVDKLQDHVMDLMARIQKSCGAMNRHCFYYIYENTSADSPLRRLAVDQAAWEGFVNPNNSQEYPKEMLLDIIVVLQKQAPKGIRTRMANLMTASKYYVNATAEETTG